MGKIEQDRAPGSASARRLPETIVERVCKLACVAALVVMLVGAAALCFSMMRMLAADIGIVRRLGGTMEGHREP